jgi:hypothetical protein
MIEETKQANKRPNGGAATSGGAAKTYMQKGWPVPLKS